MSQFFKLFQKTTTHEWYRHPVENRSVTTHSNSRFRPNDLRRNEQAYVLSLKFVSMGGRGLMVALYNRSSIRFLIFHRDREDRVRVGFLTLTMTQCSVMWLSLRPSPLPVPV